MATNPTYPGVYIEEVSTLPPSVAAVPTSIPVFIGYTEKAVVDGVQLSYPTNPIRVESLIEYQAIFGGAATENLNVTLANVGVDISIANATTSGQDFRMYYNMLMYFANGGGACYVIAVNNYSVTMPADSGTTITAIDKAEQIDEITMVIAPDAMSSKVSDAGRKSLYDAMLAHSAKMQGRFSILDVDVDSADTIADDASDFRNDNVGANNLKYGAAYYPSFTPAFGFSYLDSGIDITATNGNLPTSVQAFDGKTLETINNGVKSSGTVTYGVSPGPYSGTLTIGTSPFVLSGTTPATEANALALAINNTAALQPLVVAVSDGINKVTITALTAGTAGNIVFSGTLTNVTRSGTGTLAGGIDPDKVLYNRIKTALDAYPLELYPSSMMAGIYCSVDTDRGVWKAPANVGVTRVASLNRIINDADQSGLNIDASSGKSINAIRTFDGRGTLVWGARTLDGNSNEWRYINVRRTFQFIEHSCKLATEFVVFEPNDKNTWIRVKGMISNFLTNVWRDGALTGDKPEQAYFVKVGLGETMTAQDILEGRLIVLIGLAVVRPAEFIILKFEHKLQES